MNWNKFLIINKKLEKREKKRLLTFWKSAYEACKRNKGEIEKNEKLLVKLVE